MANRLFENDNRWTNVRKNLRIFSPLLPLSLCNATSSTNNIDDVRTFADDDGKLTRDLLAEFCRYVAASQRCALIGLSNGGVASIRFALSHTELVESMTLFASAALDDSLLAEIRQHRLICGVKIQLWVGNLDAPFYEFALDTFDALHASCETYDANDYCPAHQLHVLNGVHHWNIFESFDLQVSESFLFLTDVRH